MDGRRRNPYELTEETPVYVISVAAQLSGLHPQTLRQYDRIGLVVPGRTTGGSRRYSTRNLEQLREVAQLASEGMSLPAIARVLALENENRTLRRRVVELEGALRTERENRPGVRVFAAGSAGVTPLPGGRRIRRSTEVMLWSPRAHRRADEADGDERAR